MSPLIDVTNTGGQGYAPEVCKEVNKKGGSRTSRNKSSQVNSSHQSVDAITGSQETVCGGKTAAIKMCNTHTRCSSSSCSSYQGSRSIIDGHSLTDSMRVPPLPETADDILSHAVQALSLNAPASHKKQGTHLTRQRRLSHKQSGRGAIKSNVNSSGLPDRTNGTDILRSPQQCGACGLEFTSLMVLTQHLTKHIYDGLYAAQWLTQAMAITNPSASSSRQQGEQSIAGDSVTGIVQNVTESDGLQESTQNHPQNDVNHQL